MNIFTAAAEAGASLVSRRCAEADLCLAGLPAYTFPLDLRQPIFITALFFTASMTFLHL